LVFLIHTELRCTVNHTTDLLSSHTLNSYNRLSYESHSVNKKGPFFVSLSAAALKGCSSGWRVYIPSSWGT